MTRVAKPVEKFFLPYQERWIRDTSRLKIIEKSRQVGISIATAYRLVRQHATAGNKYDSWISSRDELQAQLFIDDCKKFAQIFRSAFSEFGVKILQDKARGNSLRLEFSNGTAIHSLSSNADAQAGKRGMRVLDEFALHMDPKKLYALAYPGITWGGQLEIISTHRGSFNFFNKLIQDVRENGNPKNFSYHRVTLEDALEQGFLKKLQTKLSADDPRVEMSDSEYYDFIKKSCPDEESFLQEYMCVPADDRSVFLQGDLVADCEYAANENWQVEKQGLKAIKNECYLGVDIGRDNDLTVFWLLEKQENLLLTITITCLQDVPFSEQERQLYDLLSMKSVVRVCIDQTGIGRQFVERACERFGRYKIEGITFTNTVKEQLAYGLRGAFEEKILKIPADDKIRSDLRSIKRETTFSGNIRFAADRSKTGHADRFWALALAIYAANSKTGKCITHCETIELSRFSNKFNNRRFY